MPKYLSLIAITAWYFFSCACAAELRDPLPPPYAKVRQTVANSIGSNTAGACGGTERWPVKVGTDPDVPSIDLSAVTDSTPTDINNLIPSQAVDKNDNTTRMAAEKTVYQVHGFLAFFKYENGPTGDQDYHLVITDGTGRYTPGTRKSRPTGHSFVAEIPNTDCFGGKHEQYASTGPLQDRIGKARACFETNTISTDGRHIPRGSIPVTVTGVAFFDFDHGQVGRSKVHVESNGVRAVTELHPVLSIEFDNGQSC